MNQASLGNFEGISSPRRSPGAFKGTFVVVVDGEYITGIATCSRRHFDKHKIEFIQRLLHGDF